MEDCLEISLVQLSLFYLLLRFFNSRSRQKWRPGASEGIDTSGARDEEHDRRTRYEPTACSSRQWSIGVR